VQINFCIKQQSLYEGLLHFAKILIKPFLFFILASTSYGVDIDVNKLIQIAKKQNKQIMFFHHIPGCPYCKGMLDENFKNATILKEIDKNFIYVDIFTANKDSVRFQDFKGTYKEFSKYMGAVAYPATVFMNNEGKIVHRAIGYRNVNEHSAEIRYVSTKSYKTMDLESYITKIELENF